MRYSLRYIILMVLYAQTVFGFCQMDHEYIEKAEHYLDNNPDSAIYYVKELLRSKNNSLRSSELNALIGKAFWIQANYDSSLFYYQLGLKSAEGNAQPKFLAHNMSGLGDVNLSLGRMSIAQNYYTQAIRIYDSLGIPDRVAEVYTSMGFLFQRSNDLEKAKSFYDRSLALEKDKNYTARIYLATWYGRINKPDSALAIYNDLLQDKELQNQKRLMAKIYLNGAIIHDQLGNHEKVIEFSDQAISYNRQLSNFSALGIVYQNLTQYHFLRGEFERSRICLDSGYYFAKRIGDLNVYIKLLGIDVEFEKLHNNYQRAEQMMEYYDYLKDSLHSIRQESLVQELNIKYEIAESKQEIAELEVEQKNAALSLARSNNQRNIFISGFLLLMVVAGFLFYQYNTKKRTSEILEIKNNQISESLAERETLLKEIHHRVKNNLQVISSLLNLQADTLTDDAAVHAVREGQNRVKSMALIHQRLYSADDVRGVDVQDYLENLCGELFSAFGVDRERVDFSVNAEGLKMDIDTVIPLGLIVNELITNSIKYAFPDGKTGHIELALEQKGDQLVARVADDGVGMNEVDLSNLNSFGWKMVNILSMKVKGKLKVINEGGTSVELVMSRYKLV